MKLRANLNILKSKDACARRGGVSPPDACNARARRYSGAHRQRARPVGLVRQRDAASPCASVSSGAIARRFPFITLALAAFALIVGALPALTNALEFTRESFARGEIWRVFTAHLTHFDAAHLRWDVFALLLLGSIAEWKSRRDWIVTLAVSAPLITLAVWILQPHFETYRGLSGLDCAAYGVVAGHLLRDGWRERHAPTLTLGVLACGGALAKCGYELITGNPFFVGETEAFAPVPLAHLVGAATGVLLVFVAEALSRQTNSACEIRIPKSTIRNPKSKIPAWLPLLNPTKASATSATRSPRP